MKHLPPEPPACTTSHESFGRVPGLIDTSDGGPTGSLSYRLTIFHGFSFPGVLGYG